MVIDMVLAVYWPPHAPGPGQATVSSSSRSARLIRPAATAPIASNTSPTATAWPRKWPGAIVPLYRMTAGTSSRARAIAAPGVVLSQPTMQTIASNMCESATSSIESAITSRLTREPFMPCVPMVMPSEMAIVLNSIGVPPAARTPRLAASARARWLKLHGIVSVQQ